MKHNVLLILCVFLLFSVLASCNGKNVTAENDKTSSEDSSETKTDSITLDSMKQAARDAGYEVSDDYYNWNSGIVNGFSVRYYADGADVISPVYEMKDNAAAESYAKEINEAGYQVVFVNGKFLSMASAIDGVIENEGEKTFFENLIFGKPIEKMTKDTKQLPDENNSPESEETTTKSETTEEVTTEPEVTQETSSEIEKETETSETELTLSGLKQTAVKTGYDVKDDYYYSFKSPVEPKNGFQVTFTEGGSFQIDFLEFANNEEAKTYKEAADEPDDMFPYINYVFGKFAAGYSIGFSADEEINAYVKNVFETANNNSSSDINQTETEIKTETETETSEAFKTRNEIETIFTNYSITLEFSAKGQETYYLSETRCDEFYSMSMNDNLMYADFISEKLYILNKAEKTGQLMPLTEKNQYNSFNTMISSHILLYISYIDETMTKSGTEVMLGRNVTLYTFTLASDSSEFKFWIDDQTGIALKYTMENADNKLDMEVKNFTFGESSPDNMIDLSQYNIME